MRSPVVCLTLLMFASVVQAQSPPTVDNKLRVEERVANLERQLAVLQLDMTGLKESTQVIQDSVQALVEKLNADVLTRRVAELEDKLGQMSRQTEGNYIPDVSLSAMAKSPALRHDVYRAVHGRFEVINEMQDWMKLYVNGQRWEFPPGVSSIHIPFGPVRAVLLNGGDLVDFNESHWMLEGDQHVLRVKVTNQIPKNF